MDMLIIKIIISMAAVIGLSLLAERISTRFAGILLGYPIATGIILFFMGTEQGAQFAAETSEWAIIGLVAEIVFLLCYYAGVTYIKRYSIALCMLFAVAGFFLAALVLRNLGLGSRLVSSAIVLILIVLAMMIFRGIKIR